MAKLLIVAAAMLLIGASVALAGPLHTAVKDGDIEQVRLLIAQGEDVNQQSVRRQRPWDRLGD